MDYHIAEKIINYCCQGIYVIAFKPVANKDLEIVQIFQDKEKAYQTLYDYFIHYLDLIHSYNINSRTSYGLIPKILYLYQMNLPIWNSSQVFKQVNIWQFGQPIETIDLIKSEGNMRGYNSQSSVTYYSDQELSDKYPNFWLFYLEEQVIRFRDKVNKKRAREAESKDENDEHPAMKKNRTSDLWFDNI